MARLVLHDAQGAVRWKRPGLSRGRYAGGQFVVTWVVTIGVLWLVKRLVFGASPQLVGGAVVPWLVASVAGGPAAGRQASG